MNGQKFYSSFCRRDFLRYCGLILASPIIKACNFKKREIAVTIAGANHQAGHLLKTNKFPDITGTVTTDTLIMGGGISGLSTARYLQRNNYSDFLLLEMDHTVGGNSKGGKNNITEYPLGAHYLPIPNPSFKELIDFLREHNVITGFDEDGLPVYNEYYLGFEPLERIYYRGVWQDSLPPKEALSNKDAQELDRFFKITEDFKNKIGTDGKPAFTIPLENSSTDAEFLDFDHISMSQFLEKNGFKSEFLKWYINYCCKDDFGAMSTEISAWAGLHYFCARRAIAANAKSGELLTWPEGNYFLVKCLKKDLQEKVKSNSLCYKIEKQDDIYRCYVYDVKTQRSNLYKCKNLVLATPQYVNKHLLSDVIKISWDDFSYYPWLVANISIRDKAALDGTGILSWDNVVYDSKSLGYVNSGHQKLNLYASQTVLTYYYNFSENTPSEERKAAYERKEADWKTFIINDLKLAHPGIEEQIDAIEVQLWGHGMISPLVGFKKSTSRKILEEGVENLHFVNSDVSGISIFEQAFYRGTSAAQKILNSSNG